MLKKALVLFIILGCFSTAGCTDKVAHVGYTDNECKYVEIDGEVKTCDTYDNTYEVIWVDSCLTPTSEDGVKASTTMCEMQ